MGIYVGVNGTPKEVTAVYVGVNGVPKECSDIYVGVNGTPKPCYSGVKPGETVFTSSTNFTVPKGVKKIDCFCVGGGGGSCTFDGNVANSGASSIGSICNAEGGGMRIDYDIDWGADGGSGGGSSWSFAAGSFVYGIGGNGGSDGGNGVKSGFYSQAGRGQGTTTRYFGESNGTLYAGGGGGASSDFSSVRIAAGGAGGGGNGGCYTSVGNILSRPGSGQANTGGGGGGYGGTSHATSFYVSCGYGGGGGGYTSTSLAQSVTPGSSIAVTVGAGGVSEYNINGGSGICIIRWGKQ